MSFYAIAALINALTSTFLLGLFIFSRDSKQAVQRLFALFCLAIALWSYGYYFWQLADTYDVALFRARLFMGGAIFIPIFYLHFVLAYLKKAREEKRTLYIGYVFSFIFFGINFTPLFIKTVVPKLNFLFWPEPGIAFHFFLLGWTALVIHATNLLFKSYKHLQGVERQQIKFILLGLIIGYGGGITNYFLWYNILIPPIGNILVTFFVVFTSYAILKHHLLNVKVISTEVFIFILGISLFARTIFAETLREQIFSGLVFILLIIFGVFIIRSVMREIETREKVEKLAIELQRANKELERLNQAKSDFLSIASHQLKTPLSIIKGYVSMSLEGSFGQITNEVKEQLKKVYISNERLISLVDDLLNLSRIEEGRMQYDWTEEPITEIINSVVDELAETADRRGLTVVWKPPAKQIFCRVDRNKIRNVVFNLVDNAIKYTDKGSIAIVLSSKDKEALISVADTGRGIAPGALGKLFNKFIRAEGMEGKKNTAVYGFGLGLYVARLIVRDHKGKVWAESLGEGKGSTFYISLPLVKEEAKNVAPLVVAASTRGAKIENKPTPSRPKRKNKNPSAHFSVQKD